MMNLLQLVRQTCGELGLPLPNSVMSSTDGNTVQILALLNALGDELQHGFPWQALDREYRFYTQASAQTGTLTKGSAVVTGLASTTGFDATWAVMGVGINQDCYVATVDSPTQVTLNQPATASGAASLTFAKAKYAVPADYDRLVNRTQWDKTKHWEMLGPQTPQQWQWLKSGYISTGPRLRWRILGGYFQIYPAPSTSEYIGFEYCSNGWVVGADGSQKSAFTLDTDTCIFPDRLMITGVKQKFFEIKGFDTTAFFRDFHELKNQAQIADAGAAILNMAPRASSILIGWENIPDSGYGQ